MIERFDQIVLTFDDTETYVAFYSRILQMREHSFGDRRKTLYFGSRKINLLPVRQESQNKAVAGSGDLSLITSWTTERLQGHLHEQKIEFLEGSGIKSGAVNPIVSIYFNDPNKNLIEVSRHERTTT